MDRLRFGIGSFVFEVTSQDEKSEEDWAKVVERNLQALPHIDDVRVEDSDWLAFSPEDTEHERRFGDGPDIRDKMRPHPEGGLVEFTLRVPERMQRESGFGRFCGAETFQVRTYYTGDSPVTFVTCMDGPFDEVSGSEAVAAVWRHLKEHLPNEGGFRFGIIGPSPFHCEPSLEPREQGDSIEFEPVSKGGFPPCRVFYAVGEFDSALEAASAMQLACVDELAFYYALVRRRNRRLRRAVEIGSRSEEVIKAHAATGFRASGKRLFGTAGTVRRLGVDILEAEFLATRDQEWANELFAIRYQDGEGPFSLYLRKEAAEEFPGYVRNARGVIDLLESGRSKELEIAIVSASTLLGAAAGAAAALLT